MRRPWRLSRCSKFHLKHWRQGGGKPIMPKSPMGPSGLVIENTGKNGARGLLIDPDPACVNSIKRMPTLLEAVVRYLSRPQTLDSLEVMSLVP